VRSNIGGISNGSSGAPALSPRRIRAARVSLKSSATVGATTSIVSSIAIVFCLFFEPRGAAPALGFRRRRTASLRAIGDALHGRALVRSIYRGQRLKQDLTPKPV
jgi:hypothetical protein